MNYAWFVGLAIYLACFQFSVCVENYFIYGKGKMKIPLIQQNS